MNTSSCMASTAGNWATMSSILIWKISWLILSPNGTQRNLYLPRCVLNVVRSEASSVKCIPKKALLLSTLENLVAPVSTWAIPSRVGALWFSQMTALFESFGLRHILNLPFAFLGYVRELTHGDDFLIYHLFQLFLNLLLVLDGNFLSSVLDWKNCRVCFDIILSWNVTYAVEAVGEQCLKIPGTAGGCRSKCHVDGVESWSSDGGPLEGWSCTGCAVFAVWGSEITWLTSLTGDIYLGVCFLTLFCKGLERSQLLGSMLHGLERTCHFLTLWAYGLERSQLWFIFATFGGWSWKESFTCIFVRGLERSLRLCILGCDPERIW